MKKLHGKVAVVTGATSGMALATAKLFVEQGASVFITGRRQPELDAAVQVIGHDVTGVRCDSANLADLDRLFETVRRERGKLDILFASAGYAAPGPTLGTITEAHFDQNFNLNAKGTLFTVQKALPLLQDGASVIMTGTMATTKAVPGLSAYSASKAALHQFARVWSLELKSRKIRFHVISPGPINTPIVAGLTPGQVAGYEVQVPFSRMGEPVEIAEAALFLASDDSTFITGTELTVDGGISLT
ncbi:SDR family NAD(P)-dependent oxidoreductase [Hymenobacter psoromatis]|uniref:SDR family NAD(P)-dependent oxidoreductase n=1 Tax=Hymenobacter psoromatis TaxID=1484116 RepID=UPI001CBBD7EC|nr:SDR family oxidoreductase [Hymenobacter psoromatis]